jgi:response regulator RpfG family c-di-GMP phosphodiesterase
VSVPHTVSRPFTVLVVDDQPIIVEGVRRLLAVLPDAKLESCMKASEALARAKALKPAVILQDIHLPDGDGLELVERYRWETELAETSVIVLSAEENAATKADAFARGADDYMVKLPPPQEFVARVQHHADVARAQRERAQAFRALERAERDLARQNALLDEANARLAKNNRELVVDVDTQRERLDRIARLSAELARVQDLDILLARILREAVSLAESQAGVVLLAEKSASGTDLLRVAEAVLPRPSAQIREAISLDATTVAGEATISGDTIRLGADACALAGKGAPPLGIESLLGGPARSALVVPIVRARDRALGALVLVDGHSGDAHDGSGFDDEDERLVGHFASLAAVAIERAQLVRSMILRMIAMAELRDPTETAGHVARVADLSMLLYDHWLRAKGIADDAASTRARDALRLGALLHDVGKVGISDAILKKPGKLDDAEFAEMKRHTEIGAQLFAGLRTDFDESAAEVALSHHERWDGRGYPRGLAGESIPIFARIVAVADVFDALSSKRAYKDAWPREKITVFFREEAGKHFDPTLAEILVAHQSDAEAIRARHDG